MINCSLVGFGKWGKVIYKSIQNNNLLNLKYVCYNKSINKNLIDKNINIVNNINDIQFNEIDLVFISADPILNYKLCKFFLLKGQNVFIEKPITTDILQIKEILKLSKKLGLIIHVDYIHIYNKNFIKFSEYFKKYFNVTMDQKLFFKCGSNGPVRKNLNTLWDWGPHVFSCLFSLLGSFNKFKIDKMIIDVNDYKDKLNFVVCGNFKSNLKIELLFGNKFINKETSIIFKNNGNTYYYTDNKFIIKNKKITKINNFIDIKPLDFSISNFINKINIKNYSKDKNSIQITKILKKIENNLLKLS